jgi:uncharacterized protein (TIGR02145 family)
MRNGSITTLILIATMLYTAQSGSAFNSPVINHIVNKSLTDVSSPSGGKDSTAARASSSATCGTYTVSDADGNVYSTVQIGDQCWMGENMRVGVMIPGTTNQSNNSITEKHCYGDLPSNCNTYGGLYQWNELMQYSGQLGAQGICPTGWHIPTWDEWQWLGYILMDNAGGKMKTTGTIEGGDGLWHAPNTLATNSSGFSAPPGGWKDDAGNFGNQGYNAFFFTSSGWWYCCAYFRQLSYNDGSVYSNYTYYSYSMSVRCLKNASALPTVSTSSISGITTTTAIAGGNVTSDGGETVNARGVVWSTTQNPTVTGYQGITSNGSGVGPFTSNLSGLTPHTSYYVRAYATNSMGTGYGEQIAFTTAIPSVLTLSGVTISAGTVACRDATQTITVSNFSVLTGGSATLISGGNILLQPLTIVQNGGNLHAYITTTQNYCQQPASLIQSDGEQTTTGVQTRQLKDASAFFTIFPNPSTGIFTLEMLDTDAIQAIHVEICSIMGKRVLQSELSGRQRYEFDLTGWPEGVYLIRIVAGNKMSVGKLIKQ